MDVWEPPHWKGQVLVRALEDSVSPYHGQYSAPYMLCQVYLVNTGTLYLWPVSRLYMSTNLTSAFTALFL